MSDDHSQFELDDELLSAYLDDELTVEERAAVERRVASDPAAQRMLDELRHVSQAVHNLPPKSVGRDLRDSILQRAGSSPIGVPCPRLGVGMPDRNDSMPPQSSGHGTLPPVTIGRSRRSWLWASLAVAAALMIAVFVPDEPKDTELPAVAQHSRDFNDQPSLSAAPEATREAASAEATVADAASEPSTNDRFSSVAGTSAENAKPSMENLGRKSPAMAAPVASVPEAPAAPPPANPPVAESQAEPLLVVRVLAKRDALNRGTFEQLLANNGVQVDSQRSNEAATANDTVAFRDSTGGAEGTLNATEKSKSGEQQGVEFLVEAPRDTIFSCVADLNQDSKNYLGVEVDNVPGWDKAAARDLGRRDQQPAQIDDLSKYNRGVVPRRGGEARARGEAMYRYYDTSDDLYADAGSGPTDNSLAEQKRELQQQAATRDGRIINNGRALRLPRNLELSSGSTAREEVESSIAEGLAREKSMVPQPRARGLEEATPPPTDANLQVLFVLDPSDEPAASPPAENPPQ